MQQFNINLLPRDAMNVVHQYVSASGISVTCAGTYSKVSPEGREMVMMVFEKYYMRTSNRASLSVVIENLGGYTAVYSVGSGGGKGTFFSFDWGAADNFAGLVESALRPYRI